MNSIKEWFKELWQGFLDWVQDVLILCLTYFKDLMLWCFEMGLDVAAFLFEQIAPPEFAAAGLQGLFNALPDSVIYFLGQSGLSEGMAILGGAYVFRFLRKLITLGIW